MRFEKEAKFARKIGIYRLLIYVFFEVETYEFEFFARKQSWLV